jgi:hypothetical protein
MDDFLHLAELLAQTVTVPVLLATRTGSKKQATAFPLFKVTPTFE